MGLLPYEEAPDGSSSGKEEELENKSSVFLIKKVYIYIIVYNYMYIYICTQYYLLVFFNSFSQIQEGYHPVVLCKYMIIINTAKILSNLGCSKRIDKELPRETTHNNECQ